MLDIDINNVYLLIAGDLNVRTVELPDLFQCKKMYQILKNTMK